MPMQDYSYMPDDKTKALTDNEIPDGIYFVVVKEIQKIQRQYAQVREYPILPDILSDSTESPKKHSYLIDTTENTLDEKVPTEYTPMEMVWRDGSLEVVSPSVKVEFDFSENILDHKMDTINFETHEVQLKEQETKTRGFIDTDHLFSTRAQQELSKTIVPIAYNLSIHKLQ